MSPVTLQETVLSLIRTRRTMIMKPKDLTVNMFDNCYVWYLTYFAIDRVESWLVLTHYTLKICSCTTKFAYNKISPPVTLKTYKFDNYAFDSRI